MQSVRIQLSQGQRWLEVGVDSSLKGVSRWKWIDCIRQTR